jgi:acyl-CoA reductase-like NAD-dependent aldehyde dehydrogenase
MAAGNATIWKPSPTTPLCSIAVTTIVAKILEKNGIPGAVAGLVTGGKDVGTAIVESRDVDLGKATFTHTRNITSDCYVDGQCHLQVVNMSGAS